MKVNTYLELIDKLVENNKKIQQGFDFPVDKEINRYINVVDINPIALATLLEDFITKVMDDVPNSEGRKNQLINGCYDKIPNELPLGTIVETVTYELNLPPVQVKLVRDNLDLIKSNYEDKKRT